LPGLVPSAESIAALIELIVTSEWPHGEQEQAEYFQRLGFQQHAMNADSPLVLSGELLSPYLAPAAGSWMSYRGDLFCINLSLYEESSGRSATSRLGYDLILAFLRGKYGPPMDETNAKPGMTSAMWRVGQTAVEMYFFVAPTPSVQIGVLHADRSATFEGRRSN